MPGLGQTAALLQIGIRADTTAARANLTRLNQDLRRTGTTARNTTRQTEQLNRSSGRLGGALGTVGKAAIAAGAAYVGLGAAKEAVDVTMDLTKSTLQLSKTMGFSAKMAWELGVALKARGSDSRQVQMAFKTLATQMRSAATGSQTAIDMFTELGITGKRLQTDLQNPNKMLMDIADGLGNLGSGAERAAIVSKLFGRGWYNLAPILRGGSDELKKNLQAVEANGAGLEGGMKKLRELRRQQIQAKIATIGLQVAFTRNLAPALTFLLKLFGAYMRFMGQMINKGFVPLGNAAIAAGKVIVGAFRGAFNFLKGAWQKVGDFLSKPFRVAVGAITGFINTIIDVINVLPGVNIGHVGGGGNANLTPFPKNQSSGNKQKGVKKQKGGVMVPGQGLGDKVAAMLEPGEFVLNRKAVQAIGLANLKRTNRQFPRFQMGGGVQGLQVGGAANALGNFAAGALSGGGTPKLPGVGSLPEWIQPTGKFVLAKVGEFIKNKLASGLGGDILLRGAGAQAKSKTLQGMGLKVGISNIAGAVLSQFPGLSVSSGLRPGDSGSYHSMGRAVDLSSGNYKMMNTAAGWVAANMTRLLTEGIHNPNLSVKYGRHVDPGFWGAGTWGQHLNHIHLAKQRGGEIFGSRLNVDQLTTLAKYVGMRSPALMAAIAMAESGGNPRSMGGAGDKGLWQIIPSTAAAFGIPYGSLFDPIKNARGAGKILRGQGLGAWTTYKSGAYRRFLGGQVKPGLLARLRGQAGTTGKTSATTKGTTGTTFGLDVGSSYDSAQANADLLQEILANYEGARSSMIDLISSGNLEALQRYQTGVAQNPLLGLAKPGMPTLASTNLPSALDMYLRSIGINRASTPYTYPGMGSNANNSMSFRGEPIHSGITHHTHVHVDGKEIAHVVEKLNRRSSRRGNRPLPGARGR